MNIITDIKHSLGAAVNTWKTRPSALSREQIYRSAMQQGYQTGLKIAGDRRARNDWYGDGQTNTGNYFPGADIGRYRNDFLTRIVTSTTLMRLAYRTLVARSEYEYRTESYGKRAIEILKTFTVGSGAIPFPMVKNKNGTPVEGINKILSEDWKRANDELFRSGSQNVSAMEAQGMEFETIATTGNILRQTVKSKPGSWLPFSFSWVKPYRLNFAFDNYFDDIWYRMAIGGNAKGDAPDAITAGELVILGQIFNKFMEPQGYYILGEGKPIPATWMSIHYRPREAEQYLGIPWLTPVLGDIFDLQQLIDDKLAQSRMLTRMGVFIDKRDKLSFLSELSSSGATGDGEPDAVSVALDKLSMTSGMESPKPILFDDKISQSLEPLLKIVLHRIAVGMGISYQLLTTDLNSASYSGSRTNTMTDSKVILSIFSWFAKSNCQTVWNKFVEMEFLAGKIPGATYRQYLDDPWYYNRCYWLPEPTDWFDPLEKIKAQRLQLQMGTLTLQDLCEENGRNFDDVLKQRSTEKDIIKKYGLEELLPSYDGVRTDDTVTQNAVEKTKQQNTEGAPLE